MLRAVLNARTTLRLLRALRSLLSRALNLYRVVMDNKSATLASLTGGREGLNQPLTHTLTGHLNQTQ
jgi:hypothetical protein